MKTSRMWEWAKRPIDCSVCDEFGSYGITLDWIREHERFGHPVRQRFSGREHWARRIGRRRPPSGIMFLPNE